MALSSTTIFAGIVFGSIGFGYFIYGKKQKHFVARYTGLALMVFPYLVSDVLALVLVGLVLMSVPKWVEFDPFE